MDDTSSNVHTHNVHVPTHTNHNVCACAFEIIKTERGMRTVVHRELISSNKRYMDMCIIYTFVYDTWYQ